MVHSDVIPFALPVLPIKGNHFTLQVYPEDTVFDIKEKIADQEGIPRHQQRLSLAREGRVPLNLDGSAGWITLAALGIVETSTLLLWRDPNADEPTAVLPAWSLPLMQLGMCLRPMQLWYTHMPNSKRFRDGRSVASAVMELVADPTKVLPLMKVVDFAGHLWCRSNRRLLVYRAADILWLREGIHFEVVDADAHFIGGLSLESLDYCVEKMRVSPFNVEQWLWNLVLCFQATERAKESRRLALARP